MSLDTLGASLVRNSLSGKEKMRVGEGTIRADEGPVRVAQDF